MNELKRDRNASIIRLRMEGRSPSDLAAQFNLSLSRVMHIIARGDGTERRRIALKKKYGACPNIEHLPHRTPIDVLLLCDARIQGWAAKVTLLKQASVPIKTLGNLRRTPDAQLLREPHIGPRVVAQLRIFCPFQQGSRRKDNSEPR